MVVKSGSYVLAIPDLTHYARHETDAEAAHRPETASSVSSRRQLAVFKKTVMKLNGNVRWMVGLVFERNLDHGGRAFSSIPHYQVTLKNPKYAKSSDGKASHMCFLYRRLEANFRSHTMLSEVFAVIIYICRLQSLHRTTGNGPSPTWSLPKPTIVSILLHVSSRTSTAGGPCSPEPCHFLFDKANCGRALKSLARSLADILRPSSTISCYRPCT